MEPAALRVEHVELDNGLRLCVNPDPVAPGVAVNLWYRVGSYDESPDLTGFAHLFEHLMFQGSANVGSGEHMGTVEAHGGTVNATTSSDRTNYFQTVPPGALDLVLWMEADRMASLAITDANFEAQRMVVKQERSQRYDNRPYGDLLEFLMAQHFDPAHPYAHLPIGSMEHLDAARLTDVQRFFADWYHPGNAQMVICGNVELDRAVELVNTHFGGLEARPVPDRRLPTPTPHTGQHLTLHRDVPHPLAYMSWLAPSVDDPAWWTTHLGLGILADGNNSRLHRRLVKEQDLAHEVHGSSIGHMHDRSIVWVMARPTPGTDTRGLADAMLEEIRRFAEDGPTAEEMTRAVASFEREWLMGLAPMEARADVIQETWFTEGTPTAVLTRLDRIHGIGADDVAGAIGALLDAEPSVLHYLTEEAR